MTRRREGQRGFGQVVLFGLLGPPETLLDPALRRIDGLLDDEALVDAVWRALRRRYPQSARRGRPATPAEVVLRLLVLKHLKGWSYEQLEWEVRGSVAYRHFCRLGCGRGSCRRAPCRSPGGRSAGTRRCRALPTRAARSSSP